MAEPTPRVRLPKSVSPGIPFRVRTRITHPMHTGLLRDRDGKLIPRRIVNHFSVRYEGEVVISVDLKRAVSADPYFEFEMAVPGSGELAFEWSDDDGSVYSLSKRIDVN